MKKKKQVLQNNTFFDINKLPKEEGLMIFPISMSRATTGQAPSKLVDYIFHFSPKKVSAPKIGLNFVYTDFLYLWSNEKASVLKTKFTEMVWNHKNALQKLIYKHRLDFQIQHAFAYMAWSQLYLNCKNYQNYFREIVKLYKKDKLFQKYLKEDAKSVHKKVDANGVLFFLEEHLVLYLMIKMKVSLPNDYIQNKEKWILVCYPGKAPKALIYLIQKNPFKLPRAQEYEGQYDLESKQFIDYSRVDLETY